MQYFKCPNNNCNYEGTPTRKAKGSVLVGLFLCLFWLLPGILYFVITSGYKYTCPSCGIEVGRD